MSDALNFLFRMECTKSWTPAVVAKWWIRTLEDASTLKSVSDALQFLGKTVFNASAAAALRQDVAPVVVSALATSSGVWTVVCRRGLLPS